MTLMMLVSLCLLLVVGGVVFYMNPQWLGKHSPGVIDWATGAPTSTQSPYVMPAPPLSAGPVYVWPQPRPQ